MAGSLQGQVALVTGASSGFGRAIAERLGMEGAAVALVARRAGDLEAVAAEIRAGGGKALVAAGDVTSPQDVARLVAETRKSLGEIDVLVSNAGVGGPFGPLWEIDPEAWWRSQSLHIRAPMLLIRALLPAMVERKAGRIIVVSALAARMVAPHMSAYCVGKIAQTRLVEEVAAETKDLGVAAFAIDPGFVVTGLAEETMNDPAAQKWLSGMVGRLNAKKGEEGGDEDLARCAQRCVDLASGRYDGLSGQYLELPDDLDARLAGAPPHWKKD